MSPDKTYTRKISISILKYSTLYTRPTLHCSIHSVNPPTYRDGLSAEGWRALLSLVMHGLCSNKYLYSASLSLTVFIGPAALAWPVLGCPSFPLSGCFLRIGSLVCSKFWHGARNPNDVIRDRTKFF